MTTDVLIVGAGLSGLTAARMIQAAGHSVIIFDKGRSVGGRLATRRVGAGLADHGAQFFTVRTPIFQEMVDKWLAEDLVYVWGHGWSDGSLKRTVSDGHPRYVTRGGMNNLARNLAQDVDDVRVNTRIANISYTAKGEWWLTDESGASYTGKNLLMTPPPPQALQLIGDAPLTKQDRQDLERIQYGPCVAGMFVVAGEVALPEPGAIQDFNKPIYWIADNQAKGISPDERVVTLHMEARYSRKHYDMPDEQLLETLEEALQPYLGDDATVTDRDLKRWRYSVPLTTHPRDILQAEGLPLVFAGDAFGGRGRVEGAYLSGYAAGRALVDKLAGDETT